MTAVLLTAAPRPTKAGNPTHKHRKSKGRNPARRPDTARFYSPAQLSELTGIPVGTLAQWRHRKYMFSFHRIGSHVLYDREHVEQVLAQNTFTASTGY